MISPRQHESRVECPGTELGNKIDLLQAFHFGIFWSCNSKPPSSPTAGRNFRRRRRLQHISPPHSHPRSAPPEDALWPQTGFVASDGPDLPSGHFEPLPSPTFFRELTSPDRRQFHWWIFGCCLHDYNLLCIPPIAQIPPREDRVKIMPRNCRGVIRESQFSVEKCRCTFP